MADHDPMCFDTKRCTCAVVRAIRRDERAAIEHRIRQSGIARWMGAADWDKLVGCVRGQG